MFENAGGFKNMKENYNRTLQACFVGYVVQAIVNNFVPLLFSYFSGNLWDFTGKDHITCNF